VPPPHRVHHARHRDATMLPSSVVEVEVGGATVFVLDMERFEQV